MWAEISLTSTASLCCIIVLRRVPAKSCGILGHRGQRVLSLQLLLETSLVCLWSLLGHSTTLEMMHSWVTSMLPGGYQPRARNGGRGMGMEGDYGLSLPCSNEANKMVCWAWSTCFEGKGHLSNIPFQESLTGQVCLVTNVRWAVAETLNWEMPQSCHHISTRRDKQTCLCGNSEASLPGGICGAQICKKGHSSGVVRTTFLSPTDRFGLASGIRY